MLYHIMGAFAENWNLSDDAEASQPSNDVVSGKTLEILNSIVLEFLWIPSNFWKFIFIVCSSFPTTPNFPSQLRKWKCMKIHINSSMSRTFPTIPLSSTVMPQISSLHATCCVTIARFQIFRKLSYNIFNLSHGTASDIFTLAHGTVSVIFLYHRLQFL